MEHHAFISKYAAEYAVKLGLDADDAAQDAYELGYLRAVDKYKPEMGVKFTTYIRKPIMNAVLEGNRNRRMFHKKKKDSEQFAGLDFDQIESVDSEVDYFDKLLEPLGDKMNRHKLYLKLHYIFDMTHKEIADHCGVTINRVIGSHYTALKKLRKIQWL